MVIDGEEAYTILVSDLAKLFWTDGLVPAISVSAQGVYCSER